MDNSTGEVDRSTSIGSGLIWSEMGVGGACAREGGAAAGTAMCVGVGAGDRGGVRPIGGRVLG